MTAWFLNPALTRFRNEVNTRWPNRDKASDGTIGDTAHQGTSSDHNPDADGSVDAWDMDDDGVDVAAVIAAALRHESIQYVIYNRKITSRSWGLGVWRDYVGTSPHTEHVHFNTRPSHENSSKPWFPEEDDMTPDQAKQAEIDAWRLDALVMGSDTARSGPAKGEPIWLVKSVKAIASAIGQVDENVGAQLADDFAAIDASIASARTEIADTPASVVAELLDPANPDEAVADALRNLLASRPGVLALLQG